MSQPQHISEFITDVAAPFLDANERAFIERRNTAPRIVRRRGQPESAAILQTVADFYHVTVSEIVGRDRSITIATPRNLAMHLHRTILRYTCEQIAQIFGRDHTTIVNGCQSDCRRSRDDPIHLRHVFEIEKLIDATVEKASK